MPQCARRGVPSPFRRGVTDRSALAAAEEPAEQVAEASARAAGGAGAAASQESAEEAAQDVADAAARLRRGRRGFRGLLLLRELLGEEGQDDGGEDRQQLADE